MSDTRCTTCGNPESAPEHHPDLIAMDGGEREGVSAVESWTVLEPLEALALSVASARLNRGEAVEPNTAAVCVGALERLTAALAARPAPEGHPLDRLCNDPAPTLRLPGAMPMTPQVYCARVKGHEPPHAHGEMTWAARPAPVVSEGTQPGCDGSEDCPAPAHLHGCYSDRGNCSEPDECRPAPVVSGEAEIVTAAELSALSIGSVVLDKGGHSWQQTYVGVWESHTQGRSPWDAVNLATWRGPFRLLRPLGLTVADEGAER